MTPLNLEDQLVSFIEPLVEEYDLKTSMSWTGPGGPIYGKPIVKSGYIPSYLTGEGDVHGIPHVVIQYTGGDFTFQQSTHTAEILISTLDDELDHQGYRDALNIAEKLKTALFTERHLGSVWRLGLPFTYRPVHVEPSATRAIEHPIYRVVMLTTWETSGVVSRFEGIVHGIAKDRIS
jgi:hypothetical protein